MLSGRLQNLYSNLAGIHRLQSRHNYSPWNVSKMAKFHDALESSAHNRTGDTSATLETLDAPVFKPTKMFYAAMSMLGVLTLAVALDATALAVALPVRDFCLMNTRADVIRLSLRSWAAQVCRRFGQVQVIC